MYKACFLSRLYTIKKNIFHQLNQEIIFLKSIRNKYTNNRLTYSIFQHLHYVKNKKNLHKICCLKNKQYSKKLAKSEKIIFINRSYPQLNHNLILKKVLDNGFALYINTFP